VLCEVSDASARDSLRTMLDLAFAADTSAWVQQPDGTWERSGGTADYQELLMRSLADRGE
jgi:hypothetical protein